MKEFQNTFKKLKKNLFFLLRFLNNSKSIIVGIARKGKYKVML